METVILVVVLVASIIAVVLLIALLMRKPGDQSRQLEATVRDDLRNAREESARAARDLREEVSAGQKASIEALVKTIGEMGSAQTAQLDQFARQLKALTDSNEARLDHVRATVDTQIRQFQDGNEKKLEEMRQTVEAKLQNATESMVKTVSELTKTQAEQLEQVRKQFKEMTDKNESRLEGVRTTLENQMRQLQESNEKKLEQMRQTVDEKLQSTLERRLGESFKLVSERLEAVQSGLGEMRSLAAGVGDLKRVLSNVKARGTWAEVQLGAILEQTLTPEQYARNVQVREYSRDVVEYAVRLPGPDERPDSCVWLPIDSKFPQEDYLRLLDASEAGDPEAVQRAVAALLRAVQTSAKDINEKYIDPPKTTDFAIMFLPTEGLYAEVLRQPGQVEELQRKYRVVVAGPTTLTAILSSLRMGFQTLALERRSHEVWMVLAAVKTEFGKFGEVLAKVKRQLSAAANTIDQTEVRTRAMARKLREVEQLPGAESSALLGLDESLQLDLPEDETPPRGTSNGGE
ncbi:MAG: DNA recombination protein RmuC [Dehalococcoidia bacterium]|nr:DNA recombination protein RmuC [Dehalococcoidia bacterium]